MPLNEMLRTTPAGCAKSSGVGSGANPPGRLFVEELETAFVFAPEIAPLTQVVCPFAYICRRRRREPRQMEIGPVTLFMTRFENEKFSKCEFPSPPRIFIGQPKTVSMMQLETAMFIAVPPPNRKTDQRVLNEQFVTVMNLQLPNNAQASSWHWMSQLETCIYSQLMK